ncbi:hypothetical protein NEA10_03035 [Phormidium yuhuli AB48]|uniref:Uncharacterized protein n=1 Tax=Phormidium yuhuli AB48 TaxID=2940671 RepID=A0ABY5AS77_9CYAN|nr:hypothetical protein [Phormidium yuhuli]USR91718.1 hypothetical protein NEA10_03035 [Phormidium yuhuli AB48]
MGPLELGLAGIASVMLTKAAENTGQIVSKEMLEIALPPMKSAADRLSTHLQNGVSLLGERLQSRFANAEDSPENPFDNPQLVAQMVQEEVRDPQLATVVEEVERQFPPMNIKIDQRKQQGIVINEGTANFNETIQQTFS